MTYIFDGKAYAQSMAAKIRENSKYASLAVVMIGDDKRSLRYIDQKKLYAQECNILCKLYRFDVGAFEEAKNTIKILNKDRTVTGIIVQLPLPNNLHNQTQTLLDTILAEKDIDGLSSNSLYTPATAYAVIHLIQDLIPDFKEKTIVMIGASKLVGKPIEEALSRLGAKVQLCDINTSNIHTYTSSADIVISATGQPHLVRPEMVKDGVVAIDIGFSFVHGKIVGDFDPRVAEKSSFFTPVPGGIGPLTVATLFAQLTKTELLPVH